jgi:ATP-dependent exoDNAse (exonuclease V) alpha subunit
MLRSASRLRRLLGTRRCDFFADPASAAAPSWAPLAQPAGMDLLSRRLSSGLAASTSGRGAAAAAPPRRRPRAAAAELQAQPRRDVSAAAAAPAVPAVPVPPPRLEAGRSFAASAAAAHGAAAPLLAAAAAYPPFSSAPPPPPPAAAPALPAAAGAEPLVTVEGTVQRVQFRDAESFYTILRLALSPGSAAPPGEAAPARGRGRPVVTVVGTLPSGASVGQAVRVAGAWQTHRQYGLQLRAAGDLERAPAGSSSPSELVAYLAGGVIPGVGPATAQRLVDGLAQEVEAVLDSDGAVAAITAHCAGVGHRTAEKIKAGWDEGRAAREGSMFLRRAGLPAALAQRVVERYGARTRAAVEADPYSALRAFNPPLAKVDRWAAAVAAPADLVSRGAGALRQCLADAAAREGHTHLPWAELEAAAAALLSELGAAHGAPWPGARAGLAAVARHMHAAGALVVELDSGDVAPGAPRAGGAPGGAAAPPRHPPLAAPEERAAYVAARCPGASRTQVAAMVETLGDFLLPTLDCSPKNACEELLRCGARIGKKTAAKIKQQWDAAGAEAAAAAAAAGGARAAAAAGLPAALRLPELLAAQAAGPAPAFELNPETRCYAPRLHAAEHLVARGLGERAARARSPQAPARVRRILETAARIEGELGLELSEGQRAAIRAAADAPILVITGGPGCGKTSVVQAIVSLWTAMGRKVRVAAPTGRAAQRMGLLSGVAPVTVHRLLGYRPGGAADAGGGEGEERGEVVDAGGGVGDFERYSERPLDATAVLLDEASMLSLPLAAALVDALPPAAQLVLVGDADQLPAVGAGAVLQALIASGLAQVVDLREVFRQAAQSGIVTSALAVRAGAPPALRAVADDDLPAALRDPAADALVVRAAGAEALPAATLRAAAALAGAAGFCEADVQVISPMRRGPAGTLALNPALQALLNPPSDDKAEVRRGGEAGVFRVGDRVLQTANNYEHSVFNGDQGRVVEASPARVRVEFPHLRAAEAEEGAGDVAGVREYRGLELAQLELAYAVTVHKAQGGEARGVVLALSNAHGRMLSRRLLYTGLTRARERLVVVTTAAGPGAPCPLARAAAAADDGARRSRLAERLRAELAARGLEPRAPAVYSNEAEVLGAAGTAARAALEAPDAEAEADAAAALERQLAANLAALPALCVELGLDASAAATLGAHPAALEVAPLAPAARVRDYAIAVATCGGARAAALPLRALLEAAPSLLVTREGSFPGLLKKAHRLAEQPGGRRAAAEPAGASLIDQLRALL